MRQQKRKLAFTFAVLAFLTAGAVWSGWGKVVAKQRHRILRGQEAKAYDAQLRATSPNYRFDMEKLDVENLAKGWFPMQDGVTVVELYTETTLERPGIVGRLIEKVAPTLNAYTVTRTDGYAVWSAWNDGNSATWEGTVYGQNTKYSAYASMSVQYNTTNASQPPPALSWTTGGLSSPEGQAASGWHHGACNSGDVAKHALQHAMQMGWQSCAGAAAGCLFAGPAYWECLAGACTATIATFFIQELSAWTHECNKNCTWRAVSSGIYECT
jgi:hypothetical protein